MSTTKWMVLVLGLGLALIAAACGDDDTVATGDASAPVTTAAPVATTAAPEPIPTPSTTETPGEFEPVGTDLTTPLPTGDVARGEQLFDTPSPVGLGCDSCHTFADASLLADPSLLDLQGPALFRIAARAGTISSPRPHAG